MRQPLRSAAVLVALAVAAAVLPLVAAIAAPAVAAPSAAADTRAYGGGPVDDILSAATTYQRPECGLSRDSLASMMMAPSFSETGAPTTVAPSPMTLSRWDTQQALWAFGTSSTPYQKAFWHPGIGLWQFDSAGGWNLTAATAINTQTAANQAAQVMSSRYCASTSSDKVAKMRYAWAPWYGCSSGSAPCLEVYNLLFDGSKLRNIVRDEAVTRHGGMRQRTCRIAGIGTTTCWYVDPQAAEGHRGWAASTGAPTPISAPFYVVEAGGREYRYWLREDTGYATTVAASKPVTSDARRSLTWSFPDQVGGALCDVTAGRGRCAPFGNFELAGGVPGGVTVAGWAIDPDSSSPTGVHIYVDGVGRASLTADRTRNDIGNAYPQYGAAHGFSATVGGVAPGFHEVCAYAIDRHGVVVGNTLLGCKVVAVGSGSPVGFLEAAVPGPGAVEIIGWTLDPDTQANVTVELLVDGVVKASAPTVNRRNDVNAVFPGYAGDRGYQLAASVPGGTHQVCARALDAKAPGSAKVLGCRQVTLPSGSPRGALEAAVPGLRSVTVSGWALDPDVLGPVSIHVYVDGVGRANVLADRARDDIAAAFPGWGADHGFSIPVGDVAPGAHEVCTYAINQGTGVNVKLGCRAFTVSATPVGAFESAVAGPVSARVRGWALDPDTTDPVNVHLYVDGVGWASVVAGELRTDGVVALPGYSQAHGFDTVLAGIPAGSHQVCAYAINRAGGGANASLGCRTVTVAGGSPFGVLEAANRSGDQVRLIGWGIDPDTPAAVPVHVYVDGVGASNRLADGVRNDVAAVHPTFGNRHGFDHTITVGPGPHTVCTYLYNVGQGSSVSLGCRSV